MRCAQRWSYAISVCTALKGPLQCSYGSPCSSPTGSRHQCEALQATGQEAADGSLDDLFPEAARGVILIGGLPDKFFAERYAYLAILGRLARFPMPRLACPCTSSVRLLTTVPSHQQ